MTAAELRLMADQWHQDRKQLPQELLYEMRKAAQSGSYYLKHWGDLHYDVKNRLRELLFSVSEGYELGEQYVRISWER